MFFSESILLTSCSIPEFVGYYYEQLLTKKNKSCILETTPTRKNVTTMSGLALVTIETQVRFLEYDENKTWGPDLSSVSIKQMLLLPLATKWRATIHLPSVLKTSILKCRKIGKYIFFCKYQFSQHLSSAVILIL